MTNKPFILSHELVSKVIETVDAGLVSGVGKPIPGKMCVEAAVCYAMGLPHGDNPTCVSPAIRSLKIVLNDARWSSDEARANGMRKLAVLQLGTRDGDFDEVEFAKKVVLSTINKILPTVLREAGFTKEAIVCENAADLNTARAAAADADRYADYAAAADADRYADYAADAAYVAARYAADAARYAARCAADADRDEVFIKFANIVEDILIEMSVPAVKFLHLLK